MKLQDAWIAWSARGEMKVGTLGIDRLPDFKGRPFLDGGLFEHVARTSGPAAQCAVLGAFQHAVLDGVAPEVADRALRKIDEYRTAPKH